jgi:cytochrome c biogenesis protein ResB
MFDRFNRWHNYLRGLALLAILVGVFVIPASARGANCTKCVKSGDSYSCQTVGTGEEGFSGPCSPTDTGCFWNLGESCNIQD